MTVPQEERNTTGFGPRGGSLRRVVSIAVALLATTLAPSGLRGQGPFHARHTGSKPGEQFGTSIAFVPDLNEDHFDELIVGVPFGCRDGLPTGRVVMLSGSHGTVLWERFGLVPHEEFGSVVGTIGDLDLDGANDILVGTPKADGNGENRGEVRVLSGSSGQTLHTFFGGSDHSGFGKAVANAGDLDGDGFDDVMVGAPEDSVGPDRPGTVTVYSGGSGEILFRLFGRSDGERFGATLGAGVDLDGDHAFDLMIGAPLANGAAGRVSLHRGRDGHPIGEIHGRRNERFGSSLATLSPTDDVRRRLWAVGAPGFLSRRGHEGRVMIFSSGDVIDEFTAEDLGMPCGDHLAPAGDIDGDHFPDLLSGSTQGHVALISGANHRVLFQRSEGPFGSGIGRALCGLGQTDSDNFPEFAIGRPFDPSRGPATGAVDVFDFRMKGTPPGIRRFGTPCGHNRIRVPRAGLDGDPYLSRRLAFTLSGAPANSSVTLLLGPISRTPLERYGLDRCMLYTTTDEIAVPASADATGRVRIDNVPIPGRRAVIGRVLVSQWICTVGNTVQTSDAVVLQLGN